MSTKPIINTSFPAFVAECMEAAKDGWEIDPDNYPQMWGIVYECVLIKDDHAEAIADAFPVGVLDTDTIVGGEESPRKPGRPKGTTK